MYKRQTEILTLLRETDGYVSGQELCEKFGVSRTAVWKAINQLKEAGYEIEAVQNKGYRLVSVPDILSESELQSVRKTRWIGEKIAFFDVVDSTNTRANSLQKRERRMEPMSLPKDRMQEKDAVAEGLTPRQGRESG